MARNCVRVLFSLSIDGRERKKKGQPRRNCVNSIIWRKRGHCIPRTGGGRKYRGVGGAGIEQLKSLSGEEWMDAFRERGKTERELLTPRKPVLKKKGWTSGDEYDVITRCVFKTGKKGAGIEVIFNVVK